MIVDTKEMAVISEQELRNRFPQITFPAVLEDQHLPDDYEMGVPLEQPPSTDTGYYIPGPLVRNENGDVTNSWKFKKFTKAELAVEAERAKVAAVNLAVSALTLELVARAVVSGDTTELAAVLAGIESAKAA